MEKRRTCRRCPGRGRSPSRPGISSDTLHLWAILDALQGFFEFTCG
jgi:hypothetical protein